MHLKRIDIFGFKSFGRDVHLVLPPGISVLVGPNGGGKSNVVDAVRWALGEQKVRELRAERWEDILHNGGSDRSPSRLAEVTLTFDNADQEMPHWPESLTVTRRYYRSGDSEYLINGRAVRLKDVTDLFLDSGLGRFSYAVISQGKVEGALLQKPHERYEQLEEASGVSRYKVRRRETLSHLEDTASHLSRVRDLRADVERQMEEVEERARTEEQYLAWERLRVQWQTRLDYTRFLEAREKIRVLDRMIAEETREKTELAEELARAEEELSGVRSQQKEIEQTMAEEREQFRSIEQQWSEAERQLARWGAERQGYARELKSYGEQRDQLVEERQRLGQDGEASDETLVNGLRERKAALANEIDAVRSSLQVLSGQQERTENLIRQWAAQRALLEKEMARMEGSLRVGAGEDLVAVVQEKTDEARKLEAAVREFTAELVRLTDERQKLREFIKQLDQEVSNFRHQLSQRQARLRVLHQLEAEGEGLSPGVRAVLKAQQAGELEGIFGTLGSLITSEPELSLAIQTALGGSHQDVVVVNEEETRRAVRFLQTRSLGRATFLPLDTIRAPKILDEDKHLDRKPGVVGWAFNLVRYPRPVRLAVLHSLGRVVITQTLEDSVRLGRELRFRYKMVTLDGQITHAGGAITGGSRSKGDNRTSRKVEMETLSQLVEEERKIVEGKDELLAHSQRELEDLENQMDAVREILSDRRNRWTSLRSLLANHTEEGMAPEQMAARYRECEEQLGRQQENMDRIQTEWRHDVERQQVLERDLAEISEKLSQEETRQQSVRLLHERAQRESARLDRQIQDLEKRLESISELDRKTETLFEEGQERRDRLRQSLEDFGAKQAETAMALDGLRSRHLELENRLGVLRHEERRMVQRLTQAEQDRVKINTRWESYEPPEDVAPLGETEVSAAERELLRIQKALGEMGPVTPGSLALFEQLSERQRYLLTEEDDVKQARQELLRTLEDLDAEVDRRIEQTALRVEEAFMSACRSLFGGGEGGFSWVSGDQTGVDLWVKPPGKRSSALSLLSGGEKALGGIAWLFALLSVRPAPFVVLDEAEASLDEANARRFASYIGQKRETTQYLIVSHHKETMEIADALWGVAGDGKGGSRLVSVLLEQANTN